jgi:hypothetical protein
VASVDAVTKGRFVFSPLGELVVQPEVTLFLVSILMWESRLAGVVKSVEGEGRCRLSVCGGCLPISLGREVKCYYVGECSL